MKKRNPMAGVVRTRTFRQRIVVDKKKQARRLACRKGIQHA